MDSTSDGLLRARVKDAAALCLRRGYPCFVGFLAEEERGIAEQTAAREPGVCYAFSGGYETAVRGMLAVFPADFPAKAVRFPFSPLGFSYRREAALCHRDFLGTLLGCGIERDAVGDILCGEGLSVAFVADNLLPYLTEQISRVGREGVTLLPDYDGALPAVREAEERRFTVASPRLDAVVAALVNLSRAKATETITAGLVQLCHAVCSAPAREVKPGDTLSVRGVGRFTVESFGGETKKGRLVIIVKKYR